MWTKKFSVNPFHVETSNGSFTVADGIQIFRRAHTRTPACEGSSSTERILDSGLPSREIPYTDILVWGWDKSLQFALADLLKYFRGPVGCCLSALHISMDHDEDVCNYSSIISQNPFFAKKTKEISQNPFSSFQSMVADFPVQAGREEICTLEAQRIFSSFCKLQRSFISVQIFFFPFCQQSFPCVEKLEDIGEEHDEERVSGIVWIAGWCGTVDCGDESDV